MGQPISKFKWIIICCIVGILFIGFLPLSAFIVMGAVFAYIFYRIELNNYYFEQEEKKRKQELKAQGYIDFICPKCSVHSEILHVSETVICEHCGYKMHKKRRK